MKIASVCQIAKKTFGKYKCPFEVYRTTEAWDLSSIIKTQGCPTFAIHVRRQNVLLLFYPGEGTWCSVLEYPKPALIPPHGPQFILQFQFMQRCVTPVVENATNRNVVNVIIMTWR